jgi:prepilin-type N-terminal cleavage/methylation domain-containing protein
VTRRDEPTSDTGTTLVEMMLAVAIFAVVVGITYGTLGNVQQQTSNNVGLQQVTESAMLGLNQMAYEIRDISNSYLNSFQGEDSGTGDIATMAATEIQFLSGNHIVANDAAGIVDPNGGSFTTGCANLIDIKLVSGNLVQTQTAPTIAGGQCTWTSTPITVTLVRNVEPLCSGSPCPAATPGAAIFSYLQGYPNLGQPTTTTALVGEVTVGFAVLAGGSSHVNPVALTQTVRLASVLADPSS